MRLCKTQTADYRLQTGMQTFQVYFVLPFPLSRAECFPQKNTHAKQGVILAYREVRGGQGDMECVFRFDWIALRLAWILLSLNNGSTSFWDCFKILCHFLSQSRVRTKLVATRTHTFSRALRRLQAFAWKWTASLDSLCLLWLVRVMSLVIILRHLVEIGW